MFFQSGWKKGVVLSVWMTALVLLLAGCASPFQPKDVTVGGVSYAPDTTDFVVTRSDFNDYEGLRQLESLKVLDLTALELTGEAYDAIAAQVSDQVKILWSVPLGEKKVPNTQTDWQVSPDELVELVPNLRYFPPVASLSIEEECPLTEEVAGSMQTLRETYPDLTVACHSQIYGQAIDSSTDKLVLSNQKIKDVEPLRLAVRIFPAIKTYEMCECGLSDEVMGGLREEFPDVTFIWVVHCGRFSIRTDAQVFSTWEVKAAPEYTEQTFAPLFRYCTELRALDLGHHGIKDISEIVNLKKLQALDLTDNEIKDISPLAELPDLTFLMMFDNKIKDLSPLENNQKLEDINIIFNKYVKNVTVVTKLPRLRRLFIAYCLVSDEDKEIIEKGIPKDCQFAKNDYGFGKYDSGWRWDDRVKTLRNAFGHWRKVKEFRSCDDVVFYE